MLLPKVRNLTQGEPVAMELSLKHPGKYVTLVSCFGAFAQIDDRLHVNAPCDATGDYYWLNGKRKPFTEAMRIADQLATPTMS